MYSAFCSSSFRVGIESLKQLNTAGLLIFIGKTDIHSSSHEVPPPAQTGHLVSESASEKMGYSSHSRTIVERQEAHTQRCFVASHLSSHPGNVCDGDAALDADAVRRGLLLGQQCRAMCGTSLLLRFASVVSGRVDEREEVCGVGSQAACDGCLRARNALCCTRWCPWWGGGAKGRRRCRGARR